MDYFNFKALSKKFKKDLQQAYLESRPTWHIKIMCKQLLLDYAGKKTIFHEEIERSLLHESIPNTIIPYIRALESAELYYAHIEGLYPIKMMYEKSNNKGGGFQ